MAILNSILSQVFSLLFWPFRSFSPWLAMIFVSLLTALFMLFLFRHTSNQEGIRKVKDKIKAHLLEIRLYKDNFSATLQAYARILHANLQYLAFSTKPMLIMLIPLLLILSHLNLWFGYEPLKVGEKAILKVFWERSANPFSFPINVETSTGIAVETPPLRLEEKREIDWRLKAIERGVHEIKIAAGGQTPLTTTVVIETRRLAQICPRQSRRFLDALVCPGPKTISSSSPVRAIEITYPSKRLGLLGLKMHWLIAYFILSLFFGFILKRPLGVEI